MFWDPQESDIDVAAIAQVLFQHSLWTWLAYFVYVWIERNLYFDSTSEFQMALHSLQIYTPPPLSAQASVEFPTVTGRLDNRFPRSYVPL